MPPLRPAPARLQYASRVRTIKNDVQKNENSKEMLKVCGEARHLLLFAWWQPARTARCSTAPGWLLTQCLLLPASPGAPLQLKKMADYWKEQVRAVARCGMLLLPPCLRALLCTCSRCPLR